MSQDPPSLHYKDQVASVPAERRRRRPQRDPDGALLAAKDGTLLLVAKSDKVSPTHQAETGVSSGRTSKRPSSVTAVAETVIPIAFPVVDDGKVPAAPSQSNNDHHRKRCPWKTTIASLALIAIVVGIVMGVVCGSRGCAGTSAIPAPIPTPAPTSARAQDITNFINLNSYKGVDLSPTGASPEERAMQWLINEDPLQLNIGVKVDEIRLLQRYSLLTLWFQAGSGTAWDDSTNWLNANECTWYGIFCQLGVVTVVDFYNDALEVGNGFGGSLSPDLGLLTDLEQLILRYDSLSGTLPTEIGLWTNLKIFHVDYNRLTGSLPSEIGLWVNLEKFDVNDNRLEGSLPSVIGLWTNLTWFVVDNNRLTGSLPSEIGLWTNLDWFDVNYDRLTGSLPSEIGSWTNSIWFDVDYNSLTGSLPSGIGLWTKLKNFYVSNNALTGTIPETIANWTLIEAAWFFDNNFAGSMPIGICEFVSGTDEMEADCDLNCSCCTKCW